MSANRIHDKSDPEEKADVRASDIACRWGGDEYVIFLPHADVMRAKTVASRMRDAAARECLHGVKMSIGVTAAVDAEPLVDAVRRADHAVSG